MQIGRAPRTHQVGHPPPARRPLNGRSRTGTQGIGRHATGESMIPKLPPLADILDLRPDAVRVVDAEGHFLFVSASFERILGYTRDEVLGRRAFDLVHPDDRAATVQPPTATACNASCNMRWSTQRRPAAAWPCSTWTWTGSRRPTIAAATRLATACCARSRTDSSRACGRTIWWTGSRRRARHPVARLPRCRGCPHDWRRHAGPAAPALHPARRFDPARCQRRHCLLPRGRTRPGRPSGALRRAMYAVKRTQRLLKARLAEARPRASPQSIA